MTITVDKHRVVSTHGACYDLRPGGPIDVPDDVGAYLLTIPGIEVVTPATPAVAPGDAASNPDDEPTSTSPRARATRG